MDFKNKTETNPSIQNTIIMVSILFLVAFLVRTLCMNTQLSWEKSNGTGSSKACSVCVANLEFWLHLRQLWLRYSWPFQKLPGKQMDLAIQKSFASQTFSYCLKKDHIMPKEILENNEWALHTLYKPMILQSIKHNTS